MRSSTLTTLATHQVVAPCWLWVAERLYWRSFWPGRVNVQARMRVNENDLRYQELMLAESVG
jgi:hypothetical protein